jgi:hypothetical protein
MMVRTYDCGNRLALAWKWRGRRYALRCKLPFPLRLSGWRVIFTGRA